MLFAVGIKINVNLSTAFHESFVSRFKYSFAFCSRTKNKMAVKIPLHLFSHNRKIANLYKKYLRALEGQYFYREKYRYEARLARAEFDVIYNEKDARKSKQMLLEKEEELYKFPIRPAVFASSPTGVDYKRDILFEDWVLDYWHPLEKAMYPNYFARRELRKQQYLEMWEKMHGPPKPDNH